MFNYLFFRFYIIIAGLYLHMFFPPKSFLCISKGCKTTMKEIHINMKYRLSYKHLIELAEINPHPYMFAYCLLSL